MANSHALLLLFLALVMVMAVATATQFKVGGPIGWTVPTDPNAMSYNQWAERSRFRIGDTLLFVYPPDRDSVLQVNQDAYSTCNVTSYIARFDDGNTVFALDRSGPFYFISGDQNNCLKNESMVIVVLADRSGRASSNQPPTMSPTPPPMASESSPPPEAMAASPPPSESSPPPESVASPPPPPPSTLDVTPSAAPTGEETSTPPPSPSAASLKVVGLASSIGVFFWSFLFAF